MAKLASYYIAFATLLTAVLITVSKFWRPFEFDTFVLVLICKQASDCVYLLKTLVFLTVAYHIVPSTTALLINQIFNAFKIFRTLVENLKFNQCFSL